jgi:hypothetical protein
MVPAPGAGLRSLAMRPTASKEERMSKSWGIGRAARLGVCAGGAALALGAGTAAGSMMHPELGARLSGMGDHAVVNLQVTAKAKKLCWTFDVGKMKGFTGASIHVGNKKTVLLHLGMHYTRKGCTKSTAMTLEHLEAAPGKYWVFLDTKGHPGDLRGKLFAGMAHM